MSSFDRASRRPGFLALGVLCTVLLAGSACTVRPLYGQAASGAGALGLADLRGRIDVAPANDRTTQIVRNALLFGFNGGGKPAAPFYKLSVTAVGVESVVSIQEGSGIPSASLYRMTVSFSLVRTADGKQVASGTRFANAPFDRNRQLFSASRAFRDAQQQAGREVAEQVRLLTLGAVRKDLPSLTASLPAGKP